MALVNFTMPFGGTVPVQSWTTVSPLQRHATAINNMLYGPAGHQQDTDDPDYDYDYKNDPYSAPKVRNPQQPPSGRRQPQSQLQYHRRDNDYLPPPNPQRQKTPQITKAFEENRPNGGRSTTYVPSFGHTTRSSDTDGSKTPPESQRKLLIQQQPLQPPFKQSHYNNKYNVGIRVANYPTPNSDSEPPEPATVAPSLPTRNQHQHSISSGPSREHGMDNMNGDRDENEDEFSRVSLGEGGGFPSRAPTFTRVQAGSGSKTQVHAILDYDDDGEDYYDDEEDGQEGAQMPSVTPVQGPIFLKNGSVPVVPLFSYPTLRNGSLVQIPIWWTALSVALGLEIRGDVIRGTPCVKRFNQLFCPTAGNSYPISRIEEFIDENKALMRRMYGDFEITTQYGPPPASGKRKRATSEFANDSPPPGVPDFVGPPGSDMDEIPLPRVSGESYFSDWRRTKRQSSSNFGRSNARSNNSTRQQQPNSGSGPTPPNEPVTGRVDACESKIEIVTPYWASNSAGKIRAIVNTQHFEQAIHQEVCTKSQTGRCGGDCGCEQKYKWHRLLAYDPDNDCRGIFMDWFLFPSCCVCRCNP